MGLRHGVGLVGGRALLAAIAFAALPSSADVVLDGSLGAAGPVGPGRLPDGRATDHLIESRLGQQAGANLFHSFSRFTIEPGRSASFVHGGPVPVSHVIARVTGGAASSIEGALRSAIPGADLWLLNPAGVVFGAGAQLELGGSLHVSTADHLRLADGARFDATSAAAPALSVAPPESFGFLSAPAGGVTFGPGTALAAASPRFDVVAGAVTVDAASLSFGGSALSLVAVASPGDLPAADLGSARARFPLLGPITLRSGALVGVTAFGRAELALLGGAVSIEGPGTQIGVTSATPGSALRLGADVLSLGDGALAKTLGIVTAPGPAILIDAGDLVLTGGARIDGTSIGSTRGADLTVRASRSVDVSGVDADGFPTGLFTGATESGRGGDIRIETPLLRLRDLGRISSATSDVGTAGDTTLEVGTLDVDAGGRVDTSAQTGGDLGQAGRLTVRASERVRLGIPAPVDLPGDDEQTGLFAGTQQRDGVGIMVSAPTVELAGGRIATASGPGNAGSPGPIAIQAGRLVLVDGGVVDATSNGSGRGGTVTVSASDAVVIAHGRDGVRSEIRADGFGAGDAGAIAISASDVELRDQARISTRSATARLDVQGGAAAGTVRIDADRVRIGSRAEITASNGNPGAGGVIEVRARESVEVQGTGDPRLAGRFESRIDAEALASGAGGRVLVEAPRILVDDGGRIEASTTGTTLQGSDVREGDAGGVTLRGREIVLDRRGAVSADTQGGDAVTGDAGDVRIEAVDLRVLRDARVQAATSSAGDGGRVVVRAERVALADGGAIVADATGSGRAGDVDVQASDTIEVSGRGTGGAASTIASRNASAQPGGAIDVAARTVLLRDGGEIAASSSGAGDAGSITVRASDALLMQGGTISTSAPGANGGNVTILAGRLVHLRLSEISADVGARRGGSILIDPLFVIVDRSRIVARAGTGRGGTIRIVATAILVNAESTISASAGSAGIDGSVRLESPDAELSGALTELPEDYLAAVDLLRARCAAERGARGSFVASEAQSVSPDDWLPPPAPAALVVTGEADGTDGAGGELAGTLVRCGAS
jgi:filamentous hemagglutinin family protein